CRLLGDLYLHDLGRADLAVACYKDFRQSSKSGADTLYKLGQAYEMLGDLPRAAKSYEQVTAYEGHPLVYEARAALSRVKQAQPGRKWVALHRDTHTTGERVGLPARGTGPPSSCGTEGAGHSRRRPAPAPGKIDRHTRPVVRLSAVGASAV